MVFPRRDTLQGLIAPSSDFGGDGWDMNSIHTLFIAAYGVEITGPLIHAAAIRRHVFHGMYDWVEEEPTSLQQPDATVPNPIDETVPNPIGELTASVRRLSLD